MKPIARSQFGIIAATERNVTHRRKRSMRCFETCGMVAEWSVFGLSSSARCWPYVGLQPYAQRKPS